MLNFIAKYLYQRFLQRAGERRRREGSCANRAVPALKENESKIPREIELKKERRGKINGKKCTVEEGWGSS